MAEVKAIGVFETSGFCVLIEGADAAVKAANVDLVEWRKVGGGYVSFVVEGEVAAVRSEIVIPRPVDEMKNTFSK